MAAEIESVRARLCLARLAQVSERLARVHVRLEAAHRSMFSQARVQAEGRRGPGEEPIRLHADEVGEVVALDAQACRLEAERRALADEFRELRQVEDGG